MRPKVLTIDTYAIADADGIAASQTPAAGGIQSITLNGALGTNLDTPRQVVITSAADESGRVFVVKGARRDGVEIIEAVAGANAGAASTVRAFKTISEILVDDDTAGAITVGTATVVQTDWCPLDYIAEHITLGVDFGGATANLTVQFALGRLGWRGSNPDPITGSHAGSVFDRVYPSVKAYDHATLAALTADATAALLAPATAIRLQSNAAVVSGPVRLEIVTAGHTGS